MFNPYSNLKKKTDADGNILLIPYLKEDNSIPVNENGEAYMVSQFYLDGDGYREWFHDTYPEGRVEVLTLSGEKIMAEVKLYKTITDEKPFSNGFGRMQDGSDKEFDELGAAITFAFKNAMRNGGFIVNTDTNFLVKNYPELFNEEIQELLNAPTAKPTKAAKKKTEAAKPKQDEEKKEEIEAEADSLLAYMQREEPKDQIEKAQSDNAQSEEDNPGEFGEEVLEVTDTNSPLYEFNGKTLEEINATKRSVLVAISRPTFRWQGVISENSKVAIDKYMAQ